MGENGVGGAQDQIRALRRFDRRLQRDAITGPLAAVRWWKRRAVRPFKVVVRAWRAVREWGDAVAEAAGMSRTRQLVDIIYLGIRWDTPPWVWYRLALFRPDRRADAEWFLHHGEHDRVLGALADAERDRWAVMDDKRTFARWATSNGLPANQLIATAVDGRVATAARQLPADDLVLKSAGGGGGRGVEFLCVVPGSDPPRWTAGDVDVLDVTGVLRLIAARSQDEPQVLERRLRPHPALVHLGVGLCTLRVVTARVGDDHPTLIATVLAIPAREHEVDNFTAGGLAAPVDPATGVLQPASTIHAADAASAHTHHPVTGAAIAGRTLPDWDAVIELAVAAHAAATGVTTVGWDVGLTDEGPVLLEANVTWNGEMPQVPGAPPLGRTPWLDTVTRALRLER